MPFFTPPPPQLPQRYNNYNSHYNCPNPSFKPAFERFEKEGGGGAVNYITINKAARKGLHHEQHAKRKWQ
eukprot:12610513-Ditylum_brightwellii.AAC.1